MSARSGALLAKRFRADALLGEGGMGEVWRCYDIEQRRDVAVKAIRPELLRDPDVARMFRGEVMTVARLGHPGIVPIYDLVADAGASFLVMALCPGVSLRTFARALPPWSFIAPVLRQIVLALGYAHARNVFHLDVKPDNVIVSDDTPPRATLVDFGIARTRRPGKGLGGAEHEVIGTIEYMAPEQCAGAATRFGAWTDLYAVGTLAFELCSGHRPFHDDDLYEALARRQREPAPTLARRPGIPPEMVPWCASLLAIEPRDRPLCAADALAALDAMRAPDDASASPTFERAITRTHAVSETAPTIMASPITSVAAEPRPVSTGARASSARVTASTAQAFTGDADMPLAGAYGLFGLRDLPALGRSSERLAIWNVVDRAIAQRQLTVGVLAGPAGCGKSRLARDAIERAHELGLAMPMQTAWSASGASDEGLNGLLEVLFDARGSSREEVRERVRFWLDRVPGEHADFEREVELLLRPPPGAAPDAGLPIRVAVEAIERAAKIRPVLLWLDDVQWSRGQAAALVAAVRARTTLPVCALMTARVDDPTRRAELESYARETDATYIAVDPLDLTAAKQLVRGLLDVDEELSDLIARRAEGNPLFASQLLGELVGQDAIERRDGCYRLSTSFDASSVPTDIGVVWDRRIEQSGAAHADLCALALVRERVAVDVASRFGRLIAGTFDASLAAALQAGLLSNEAGVYAWAHGLLREHLVKSCPRDLVVSFHAAAAEALAPLVGREDVQEERARHLRAAGQDRAACEALLDAALYSLSRADDAARAARLDDLAAWTRESNQIDLLARALAERGYLDAESARAADSKRAFECVTELLEGVDLATKCRVESHRSQAARLLGNPDEGMAATNRALELAREAGDAEVETFCLLQLALDAVRRGDAATATALCDTVLGQKGVSRVNEVGALRMRASALGDVDTCWRAVETARAAGLLRLELVARQVWVNLLWTGGDRARAREEAGLLAKEAARRGLRQTVSILAITRAQWALEARDWAAVRIGRDDAIAAGALQGAMPERCMIAGFDVALALASKDDQGLARALATLELIGVGFRDRGFTEIIEELVALAPPAIAERLRSLVR